MENPRFQRPRGYHRRSVERSRLTPFSSLQPRLNPCAEQSIQVLQARGGLGRGAALDGEDDVARAVAATMSMTRCQSMTPFAAGAADGRAGDLAALRVGVAAEMSLACRWTSRLATRSSQA